MPSHSKEMKRKYHAGAKPEPEPYHAHETDYSHKESSEEESGEFRNRKVNQSVLNCSIMITLIMVRPETSILV